MTYDPAAVQELLALLDDSIGDERLSDEEKRRLAAALQNGRWRENDLRRLRNRAFDLLREHLTDPRQLGLLKWLEGIVRTLDGVRAAGGSTHSEAFFSPGSDCLSAVRKCLRETRVRADICVFTLSDDRIAEDILAAHRRGIAIRLLTDNAKELDPGSDIGRLRDAGIAVAVDRTVAHMHHKFAIFDGMRLLNGSYNWTRSASDFNEENLVISDDPGLVSSFSAQFDKLWNSLVAGA